MYYVITSSNLGSSVSVKLTTISVDKYDGCESHLRFVDERVLPTRTTRTIGGMLRDSVWGFCMPAENIILITSITMYDTCTLANHLARFPPLRYHNEKRVTVPNIPHSVISPGYCIYYVQHSASRAVERPISLGSTEQMRKERSRYQKFCVGYLRVSNQLSHSTEDERR